MGDKYSEILKNRNVKSSYQRIKILEYLDTNPCHPYADKIYYEIQKTIPTISKSTVYSTFKAYMILILILAELNMMSSEDFI